MSSVLTRQARLHQSADLPFARRFFHGRVAEKMRKGAFDLADLRDQLEQMNKIGGMSVHTYHDDWYLDPPLPEE